MDLKVVADKFSLLNRASERARTVCPMGQRATQMRHCSGAKFCWQAPRGVKSIGFVGGTLVALNDFQNVLQKKEVNLNM